MTIVEAEARLPPSSRRCFHAPSAPKLLHLGISSTPFLSGGFARGVNGDDPKITYKMAVLGGFLFGAVVTSERVWDVLNLT